MDGEKVTNQLFEYKRKRDYTLLKAGPVMYLAPKGLSPYLKVGKKLFWLPSPAKIEKAIWKVRGCFPTFWAIGLRDCDTGGRVFGWGKAFAWNHWHLAKLENEWVRAGDGPAGVHRLSLLEYIKAPSWQRV